MRYVSKIFFRDVRVAKAVCSHFLRLVCGAFLLPRISPPGLFLHIHHLIPYSQGGPTLPHCLLGLCVGCHKNVHDGFLRIFQTKEGSLVFTDADGNSLAKQADLELARWLDTYQGWEGEKTDSHSLRARNGDWAVFA